MSQLMTVSFTFMLLKSFLSRSIMKFLSRVNYWVSGRMGLHQFFQDFIVSQGHEHLLGNREDGLPSRGVLNLGA